MSYSLYLLRNLLKLFQQDKFYKQLLEMIKLLYHHNYQENRPFSYYFQVNNNLPLNQLQY